MRHKLGLAHNLLLHNLLRLRNKLRLTHNLLRLRYKLGLLDNLLRLRDNLLNLLRLNHNLLRLSNILRLCNNLLRLHILRLGHDLLGLRYNLLGLSGLRVILRLGVEGWVWIVAWIAKARKPTKRSRVIGVREAT